MESPRAPREKPCYVDYNAHLPYNSSKDEADAWLDAITQELLSALKTGDLGTAAVAWSRQLNEYLTLGLPLTPTARGLLAEALYAATTSRPLDLALVHVFAGTCCRLLKKDTLVPPGTLLLPWRPLFDVVRGVFVRKQRDKVVLGTDGRMEPVLRLVQLARAHFEAGAAAEIVDEFESWHYPQSVAQTLSGMTLLGQFVPTAAARHGAPAAWLPRVLALWPALVHVRAWDAAFLDLLARVARDWGHCSAAISGLDAGVHAAVFAAGLRLANVATRAATSAAAAGSGPPRAVRGSDVALAGKLAGARSDSMGHFALYIACTLENGSLPQLQRFFRACESFFHPSNSGRWSGPLHRLLRSICHHVLARVREGTLSENAAAKVSALLRPVLFVSLWGKDGGCVAHAVGGLVSLAWLSPGELAASVRERILPALEAVTEVHRTVAAISALAALAFPLSEDSAEGVPLLLDAAHAALPGVDPNDLHKTAQTALLVANVFAVVPRDSLEADGGGAVLEWVLQLLDRAFAVFENVPQDEHRETGDSVHEGKALGLLQFALATVLGRLSVEATRGAVSKVVRWIETTVVVAGADAVARIGAAVASADTSGRALTALLGTCVTRVRDDIVDQGAGCDANAVFNTSADAALAWYQAVLENAVCGAWGDSLVAHGDLLVDVLELQMSKLRARANVRRASRLLGALGARLTGVYVCEGGHDGGITILDNLAVKWHIPRAAALNLAERLWTRLGAPVLNVINSWTAPGGAQVSNDELWRTVVWFDGLLHAVSLLGVEAPGKDALLQPLAANRSQRRRWLVTDALSPDQKERWQQRRLATGATLLQLLRWLAETRRDAVEVALVAAQLAETFLCQRGVTRADVAAALRFYAFCKEQQAAPVADKRRPRGLLLQRLQLAHALRLRHNAANAPVLELHAQLVAALEGLALGPYASVRRQAQAALSGALRAFAPLRYRVVPRVLSADPADEHAIKGALFVLSERALVRIVLRDWEHFGRLLGLLAAAEDAAASPLVHDLVRRVFYQVILTYSDPGSWSATLNESALSVVSRLAPLLGVQEVCASDATDSERGPAHNSEHYRATLLEAARLLQGPRLHWRFASILLGLLELVLTDAEPVPAVLARAVLAGTTSELLLVRQCSALVMCRLLLVIKTRSLGRAGGVDRRGLPAAALHAVGGRKVWLPSADVSKDVAQPFDDDAPPKYWVDACSAGWNGKWPESIVAYRADAPEDPPGFPFADPESAETLAMLDAELRTDAFWDALLARQTLEQTRGGAPNAAAIELEAFNAREARLYKSLFQMFGPLLVPLVRPRLEKLAQSTSQRSAQRCAAELLAGLLRGMKHWSTSACASVWAWAVPLLQNVLDRLTPESLVVWFAAIKFVLVRRDPRRAAPLLRLLWTRPLHAANPAFFDEAKRLCLVREAVDALFWRLGARPLQNLARELARKGNFTSPYQQVRELQTSTLQVAVRALKAPGPVTDWPGLLAKARADATLAPAAFAHAAKTWLALCSDAFSDSRDDLAAWIISNSLTPLLALLDDSGAAGTAAARDPELATLAKGVFRGLMHVPLRDPARVLDVLLAHLAAVPDSGWHARAQVLPVLQQLFFAHLPLLDDATLARVADAAVGLLADDTAEIREMARDTLAGLVQCLDRDAARERAGVLLETLNASPVPARPSRQPGEPLPPAFVAAVSRRHAAVLALSAVILAFPYNVPSWMPPVLVAVARCVNNPSPIAASVRRVFSEWRRTHVDTLHEDISVFSDDDRHLLLELLVSPSYYA